MTREHVLSELRAHQSRLARDFGVSKMALFGSVARNDAGEDSDVDVLVRFDGPAMARRYFGVQFYLEDLLGCPVDLVTHKALRSELRPTVAREAIHV